MHHACLLRCAAAALLLTPTLLSADDPGPVPLLESTTHLGGSRSKVVWSPRSNTVYRVEKSTTLSPDGPGGWTPRALVEGGEWVDPEPPGGRAFYRVPAPPPEVFEVQPAVVARAGGMISLVAQCLPQGSALMLEIPGEAPMMLPLLPGPNGSWRAAVPALPPGDPVVASLSVVDGSGATVTAVSQTLEITESGLSSESPPWIPPASPLGMAINEKGLPGDKKPSKCACATCRNQKVHARMAGGGDDDCDGLDEEPLGTLLMPALMKAKEKANRTKCSNNLRQLGLAVRKEEGGRHTPFHNAYRPGEVSVEQEVLSLTTPAGPNLRLSLHYRSRAGTGGVSGSTLIPCGPGWTCSYDIRIVPVPPAAGASAPRLHLFGGDGRRDVLVRQPDGSYRGDGMFREGRFDPDTTFRLTFSDKSEFIFCRLVGAPWSGRIGSIVDANGVAISFTYNAASQLETIASQFGQRLTLTYDAAGALSTVTDHTGRFVRCGYFAAGEPDGNEGDLKSVSCPQIGGQQPLMGPATFTYTTGNPDPRLNRNLLIARDGANAKIADFGYSTVTDPADIEFDTCVSADFHRTDELSGHVTLMKFEIPPPVAGSPVAYRCTINDPEGRVTECDFDAQHREVACRQFTGYATPGVVTTSTANRPDPATRRRDSDPAFYETQCRYNPDHRIKIRTLADGTQERTLYGRELRRDCPVRERGNAHVITLRSVTGEERTVTCDYLPGFGTCEGHGGGIVPQPDYASNPIPGIGVVVPRQKKTAHRALAGGGSSEDDSGEPQADYASNPIPGVGVVIKRNPPSSTALVAGSPIGGLSIKGGKNPPPGAFRAPSYEIEDVSQSLGPDYITSHGLPKITPKIAKESHGKFRLPLLNYAAIEFAGVWAGEDGEGGCTQSARGVDRNGNDCTHHGRPKLHHMTRLVSSHGQTFTWSFDSRGNCLAMRTPVAGSGCDLTYNSLGQCTGVTVLNGPGVSLVETYDYDAATGFIVNAHTSPFDLNLTTAFEHDPLGRLTRMVDARGHDWIMEYDVCDRETLSRSAGGPTANQMPNRISMNRYYNGGGQLLRMDIEHRDAGGALVAENPAYTAWVLYDSRLHVSRIALEQRPVDAGAVVTPVNDPPLLNLPDYAVVDFTWNDAGECVQLAVPAASRGQSKDAVCLTYYDERGLEWQCQTGLPGAPGTTTVQTDYRRVAGVARRMLLPAPSPPPPGAPAPNLETLYDYDGFHRLTSITDPMGNVTQFEYDEQGFVTISVRGEVNDVPGSADNVLLARGRGRAGFKGITESLSTRGSGGGGGGGGGGSAAKWPYRPLKADIVVLKEMESPEPVLHRSFHPAFFDMFVEDDVWTWERFAPGAPAPHETETLTVDRSPGGHVHSATLNGDILFSCAYDSAWRLLTIQDARVTVTTVRDQAGNVVLSRRTELSTIPGVPPKTFTFSHTYDALNRCTGSSDGGGNSVSRTFDSCDRITQCTDPRGVVHRFRYDGGIDSGAGTPPVPFTVLHECDVDNNGAPEVLFHAVYYGREQFSSTDSNGYTTTCLRDSACNLAQCSFPDGTAEIHGFDIYGRGHSLTHKDGTVVVADLDRDGRLDLLTYSGGTPGTIPVPPTDYRYNGLGFLTQCDQGDSHLVFTWDSMGNQLSESHNGHTITRTFTHRGRSGIVYPDGTQFIEARDQFGNIQSVSLLNSAGVALTPPVTQLGYSGHRVTTETRANGVVTTHEYRADGESPLPGGTEDFSFDECVRSVCVRGTTVLYSTRIRRDRGQNVTQHDAFFTGEAQAPGRRHVQEFDPLGRLITSTILRRESSGGPMVPESSVAYTLDTEGRRLTVTGGANPGVYTQNSTIPPGDHQMGQYSSWPGGPLEWNDHGCLTLMSRAGGPQQFIYDQASRLVAVLDPSNGTAAATYAYDAAGRRTRSTIASNDPLVPSVETFYIYDGPDCVQELGVDGMPNFTVGAIGVGPCISTRNGTIMYPHGGGGTARGTPIPKFLDYMKKGKRSEAELNLFTNVAGEPSERLDCDDAGYPIFLTSDGLPRPGATDLLNGYRWLAPACIWCPESRLIQGHGTLYSPELGVPSAREKKKPKGSSLDTAVKASWNLKENVK